jgi:Flp pilus assembly protein TadG
LNWGHRDRGASLVEFALVAPMLILLLLGIIEFGFFLGEWNELKHGAHEGARLAAVDDSSLLTNTCDTINLNDNSSVAVTFTRTGDAIGDTGTVVVTANVSSLSGLGLIEIFLPASIDTDAEFRIEQPPSWANGANTTC